MFKLRNNNAYRRFLILISIIHLSLMAEDYVDSGEDIAQAVNSSISLSDQKIKYNLRVGVIKKENRGFAKIKAKLLEGQTQIVALGASDGGDRKQFIDTPIDSDLMERQGFSLVDVDGDKDARSEIWLRKHSSATGESKSSIIISGEAKGVGWALLTLDVELNLSDLKANVVKSGAYLEHEQDGENFGWIHMKKGDRYNKRFDFVGSNYDFKIISAFFDDPYVIYEEDHEDRMVTVKKYGDGDTFFFGLWGEKESVKDKIRMKRYGKGSKWKCDVAIISAKLNIEL